MQTSNKFKPCKKCGCRACSRSSGFKQFSIRAGNRQFRRSGRINLGIVNIAQFEDGIINANDSSQRFLWSEDTGWSIFDVLDTEIVGIGYTD